MYLFHPEVSLPANSIPVAMLGVHNDGIKVAGICFGSRHPHQAPTTFAKMQWFRMVLKKGTQGAPVIYLGSLAGHNSTGCVPFAQLRSFIASGQGVDETACVGLRVCAKVVNVVLGASYRVVFPVTMIWIKKDDWVTFRFWRDKSELLFQFHWY